MPHVTVVATVADCDPDELFEHVARFDSYADIAQSVRTVSVTGEGDDLVSTWEVDFRKGILKWQEEDSIDRPNRRITFDQTHGDLAVFVGNWSVTSTDEGARVEFNAEFDLGIPSLASMLDPAAARTLIKNARELIVAFARAAGDHEAHFETPPAEPARA
jgi:ribosome-associated toxin RatA of RatAB toxin-antitoxin module